MSDEHDMTSPLNQGDRPQPRGWKRSLLFKATLVIVLLVLAAALFLTLHSRRKFGTAPEISSGPWGDLQVWDIRLDRPVEYVTFDKTSSEGPSWHFGLTSPEGVKSVLEESGCSEEEAKQLLKSVKMQKDGTLLLCPDDGTLLAMAPEVRSKLYLHLSRIPGNPDQASPYLVPGGDAHRLLKGKFKNWDELASLVTRLSYPRNGYVYFSDPEIVIRKLANDPAERLEFLKAISGCSAVMARLLIRPDSSIDLPLIYWGLPMPGVLLKDLRPLMEAQKQLPEGGAIPISYVLSPMARENLYKTPLPPQKGEKLPDCHWTALNFFNFHPDPRMSDLQFATQYVKDNYYEIGKPGIDCDLVLLTNAKGEIVHSAVYLAADIVYTKNGVNFGQPWVLMHEKDMVGLFSALEPVEVHYFRKNDY